MKELEMMEIKIENVVALREKVVALIKERQELKKQSRANSMGTITGKHTGVIVGILRVAEDLGIDLRIDREGMDYIVHEWQPLRRLNKYELGALSTIHLMQLHIKEMERGEYEEDELIWIGDESHIVTKTFSEKDLKKKAQGLRDSIETITKMWRLEAHV